MGGKRERWEPEALRRALDAYLGGKGMKAAAAAAGRSAPATMNVIRSDFPRNYRGCVGWLPPSVNFHRREAPWTTVEDKYLMKLKRYGRLPEEMVIILGRPWKSIEQRLAKFAPRQTSPGFGFNQESR